MEVKSVTLGWYEKCDISENELLYAEELLSVDNDLKKCDNILSEVGLQIGYSGYEKQIYEIAEKRQHLWAFVQALMGYIEIHLDEPLRQKLNHGACETISRIHMADFHVENTLGLTVIPTHREYWGVPQAKDRLNLEDFIGNALGESADGNRIPGTNNDCVEEFAVIFQQQYDNMLAMGMLGEDIQELEDYLDYFASMGEYDHKEDQPFYKALLSNVLDLTIIKPLIESCCGYDLITKEDLTEMERNMKVIGALVDMVTLATGIYGFSAAAKNMGWKKATAYFAQLALVDLASDVSATTVATIGDYCDWPMGVTLLLSLGTGLTVGQIGNHLIFERNGIEIFRKEVSESGELLEDLMSPEDAARFQKFLEEGSTAGLTPEELAGIGKVDDYLALNKVDYDDVLALRKEAFDKILLEDLMSPEDAARFRKFLEEGSTAGLTPEELAGLRKVDDYLALNKVDYDDVLALRKEVIEGGSETVTYRRVQGGEGVQSQQRVIIDKDGNVYIPNKERKLNISIDNGEHSQYFVNTKRPGADIYEFEVPKWFDDFVKENTIPQQGYRSNPLNQGGTAPSLNDVSTPGTCIEFPAPWIEWIEEYSSNGRVIKGGS